MDRAQEVKAAYGQKAKDYILNGLGLEEKSGKVKCPYHKDKKPSMAWYQDGLMWKCFACGEQVDIYRYLMDYEHMSFPEAVSKVADMAGAYEAIQRPKKEYKLPKIETNELSQRAIDYMAKRRITKDTLDEWKVKSRKWNGQEVYVFQYFDEAGKLVYVSYRGIGKGAIKGGCEPDTKPILWGMWHVDKRKPLVITEGQPDAMCVYQAGYHNVVSVPNGSKNLKWIDNCWDWLQDVSEFIVFGDNDEPGKEMAENIKRRLKNVTVLISAKRKDANEVLYFDGPEVLKKMIDDATKAMPAGLMDVSQMAYRTVPIDTDTIETGFIEYDEHVEDWKQQEITIVFGRNGEGKTTFMSQVITHCMEEKVPTFLYSGEMSDHKIQSWLYKQLIGGNTSYLNLVKGKYRDKVEPKPEVVKAIKEWHRDELYLFDRSEKKVLGNLDGFFSVMELAAKRFGCKLFVIDNLMSILEENADSLYSDQANFIQRCKDFAVKNWVHLVLLAHPSKAKGEMQNARNGNLDKTDISGSNNIANKADNIIAVERNWGDDREWDEIITSLKDRESGQRKVMRFYFSQETLRFYNERTAERKNFTWEKYLEQDVPDPSECPF
jgi:twinkle protein